MSATVSVFYEKILRIKNNIINIMYKNQLKRKGEKMKLKSEYIFLSIATVCMIIFSVTVIKANEETVHVTSQIANERLSNQKIGWGIKRGKNHTQPDLGSKNKRLIEKYNGMALGNVESKNVYLTFDNGYEAGYTDKILDVLKQNNVKATFFITAHYANSASELLQRMIEEGHTIR